MFLVNSRLSLFIAASSGSSFDFTLPRHPFFRSYGVNLPSSLTRVLSIALGFSPRLPVSVLVQAPNCLLEAFLGSVRSTTSPKEDRHHTLSLISPGFAKETLLVLERRQPNRDGLPYYVTPLLRRNLAVQEY